MANDLIKALGRFLTRDIVFILGGASIILTLLYIAQCGKSPFPGSLLSAIQGANNGNNAGFILWIIGIAWVLGYTTQEFFSILQISTPQFPPTYPWCLRWFFKRITFREWRKEIPQPLAARRMQILGKVNDKQHDDLERIITLKIVGTTMGPSGLVCAIILAFAGGLCDQSPDKMLVISIFVISIILILLGWMKVMQEAEWFFEFDSPNSS